MPGIEDQPPSPDQVSIIRQKFQEYITENGKDNFDALDIQRVLTEDFYVHRWFMHVFDMPGDQIETCTNNMIKALKWRKDENIREITSDTLSPVLKERGSLYLKNKDKDGWPLLVFAVRKHVKGIESPEIMKQHFLYYMDRIDRETKGGQMSLVFECEKSGLKNMDMDLIQYMIKCFEDYFPYCLNYILVIEMSWVLNAAWKIIKGWLPAAGVKKIKFLTKSNLSEYIPEDQQLVIWGGKDEWEYEFVEEDLTSFNNEFKNTINANASEQERSSSIDNRPKSLHILNGESTEIIADGDGRKKSVTWARTSPTPSNTSSQITPNTPISPHDYGSPGSSTVNSDHNQISSSPNIETKTGSSPPQTVTPPPSLNTSFNTGTNNTPSRHLLGLTPSDEVVFDVDNTSGQANGLQAKLQIKNIANKAVVFKIKTTSPEKYRVRPSASHIKIGGMCDVEIHVHQSQLNEASSENSSSSNGAAVISPEVTASLMKDKFLVTAITLEEDSEEYFSQSKLNELLKTNRPEAQYRLRCSLSGNQHKLALTARHASSGIKEISPTSSTLASANKQLENLSKKVTELKQNVTDSAETIASLRKTTMIMLGIILFLQLILTYQMMSLNPSNAVPDEEDIKSFNNDRNSEHKEL